MKKRKNPSLLLIAVFAAVATVFIAKSNNEPSDCFLWRVEINKSTFYLAGSIHAGNDSVYPLPKAYMNSYKKTDKVIFELEEGYEDLKLKIMEYAEKDRLEEDQYLNLYLSQESQELLQQIFDLEELQKLYTYEGWYLNMSIAGKKPKFIGMDPMLAVDMYFHNLAIADHKDIIGLDSIETQLRLFDFDVPLKSQVLILEKAISKMEEKAKKEAPLYEAYYNNDLEQFEKEFLKPYDFDNPQMKMIYDRVFTNRNTNWVDEMEKLSSEPSCVYFMLVGSGHYFGPNNIREILEQRGYKVEKI